jgi:hypothetical protein
MRATECARAYTWRQRARALLWSSRRRQARILARPLSRSGTTCDAVMARHDASACSTVRGSPPRPGRRGRVGRSPGTVGFMKRRDRPVDAEIRGVSHHCRIVTYQNAAKAVVEITTSSLPSVTSRYGRVGLPVPPRAFQRPGPRAGARNTLGSDPGSTMSRDGMKESPP